MRRFPYQIWVVFTGSLIFSVGSSMVWPYLNIYLQEKLNLPLSITTLLISLRAVSGILASFVAGSIADKIGRRGVMLASLLTGGLYYLLMSFAGSLWQFALLMAIWGALDLFYPVGSNAMIADIVAPEDRLEAFSMMRMMYNAGFAIGPIIGGILAASSYAIMFYAAAIGYFVSFAIMVLTVKETLPKDHSEKNAGKVQATHFADVLQDGVFVSTILMTVFIYMGSSVVFNLLSLYARETFGILEKNVSVVYTVNALMCVSLQLVVMRVSDRFHPFLLLTFSALFYMAGLLMFGVYGNVAWFCFSMFVLTVGELMNTPTLLAMTAKRAPADARGRYMSIYNLAHPIGYAFGPAIAGNLYDHFIPQSIWLSGGFYCLIAAIGYFLLFVKNRDAAWLRRVPHE